MEFSDELWIPWTQVPNSLSLKSALCKTISILRYLCQIFFQFFTYVYSLLSNHPGKVKKKKLYCVLHSKVPQQEKLPPWTNSDIMLKWPV